MADDGGWHDYEICPPCLVDHDHASCDGDKWWCECAGPCLPSPPETEEQL